MRKIYIIFVLLVGMSFTACENPAKEYTDSNRWTQSSGKPFAAQITPNDTTKPKMWIEHDDYLREYNFAYIQSDIDGIQDKVEKDVTVNQMKVQLVEHMLRQALIISGAAETGLTFESLSDEEKAKAYENADSYISQLSDQYGREIFDETGLSEEYIQQWFRDGAVEAKIQEGFIEQVEQEEFDVDAYLDSLEQTARETYEEDFEKFSSEFQHLLYYIPPGTRAADIVRVYFDEKYTEQMFEYHESGDYETAEAIFQTALSEIVDTAEEIAAKLNSSISMARLEEEYKDNPSIFVNPNNPVLEGVQEVTAAVFDMEVGDIALIADERGWLVVAYTGEYEHSPEIQNSIQEDALRALKELMLRELSRDYLRELEEKHTFDINYELLEVTLENVIVPE
ncbi:MAG: hypothetical protein FWH05_02590 [Oscillospiraceae bacterium]|nr:hypothetical protein [Oscillospiraceae bacterium]